MIIVSAAEMREIDAAVQRMGVPALILMENAGRALADHAERLLAEIHPQGQICGRGLPFRKKKIAILAGPGQNGGDGFCAARHLASRGYSVKVGVFGTKKPLPKEAALNLSMLKTYPVEVLSCQSMAPADVICGLGEPDLIIDALLGIGAQGNPRFPLDIAIKWANSCDAPVVACDIPSGVSADTGQVHSPCVQADLTVTMGFAKLGLISFPGRMYSGDVVVEGLSFRPGLVSRYNGLKEKPEGEKSGLQSLVQAYARGASMWEAGKLLPIRAGDHHKGRSGHVLVVAGSLGMAGAAVLSAKAALRAGAGTATLLCPGEIYGVCASMVPEVMVIPCGIKGTSHFDPNCIDEVRRNIEGASAVVVGPGWGRGDHQKEFLKEILCFASKKTFIVDADALFALKQLGGLSYLADVKGSFVLTPHPGELSVLTGLGVEELEKDRAGYAREASRLSKSVVCLKGAGTCTSEPSGRLVVNPTGGPELATAGSGDVLTGVIAALAAQGLGLYESAWLGVFWHGLSGEVALRSKGSYGILADDIIEYLPKARSQISQEYSRLS